LEKSLRNKRVKNFVLSDNEVLQVTELVKKVEKFYKIPIDIEWAFEKNKLYLLQARPITAYFKVPEVLLTKPEELKNAYMDTMIIKQ
jgi:pyruvate,water dikinase